MVVGAQRAEGFVDGEVDHCILCAVQCIEVYDTVKPASPRFWLIAFQHLLLPIIYLPLQMMQKCSFTNLCGKWYWSCGLAYWCGSFTSRVDRISHRVPENSLYRSVLMISCLTWKCLPDTVRPLSVIRIGRVLQQTIWLTIFKLDYLTDATCLTLSADLTPSLVKIRKAISIHSRC